MSIIDVGTWSTYIQNARSMTDRIFLWWFLEMENLNPRIKIFFYPERGSAEFWKNVLIQGLRFLQL